MTMRRALPLMLTLTWTLAAGCEWEDAITGGDHTDATADDGETEEDADEGGSNGSADDDSSDDTSNGDDDDTLADEDGDDTGLVDTGDDTFDGGGVYVQASLIECDVDPQADLGLTSEVVFTEDNGIRYIDTNAIPDHRVGAYPNSGNPNSIAAQDGAYTVPVTPSGDGAALSLGDKFGIALSGVAFDPLAAEYYNNDSTSGWQYDALGPGPGLGLDCNGAHVQPDGTYHYHGMPEMMLSAASDAPEFIGYAADGYPIYARWGYADADDDTSEVVEMVSSWRLRDGTRDSGPGGEYDGTFNEDYEYVAGSGHLDECNGRTGVTAEFGTTYYYVLTDTYPYIPRCLVAEADASFAAGGAGGGTGPGPGMPPRP